MARLCHRMCDQQYQKSPIGAPDRLPSLLSIKAAILTHNRALVGKYPDGQFEADAMLSSVRAVFVFIPFEGCCHVRTV